MMGGPDRTFSNFDEFYVVQKYGSIDFETLLAVWQGNTQCKIKYEEKSADQQDGNLKGLSDVQTLPFSTQDRTIPKIKPYS